MPSVPADAAGGQPACRFCGATDRPLYTGDACPGCYLSHYDELAPDWEPVLLRTMLRRLLTRLETDPPEARLIHAALPLVQAAYDAWTSAPLPEKRRGRPRRAWWQDPRKLSEKRNRVEAAMADAGSLADIARNAGWSERYTREVLQRCGFPYHSVRKGLPRRRRK